MFCCLFPTCYHWLSFTCSSLTACHHIFCSFFHRLIVTSHVMSQSCSCMLHAVWYSTCTCVLFPCSTSPATFLISLVQFSLSESHKSSVSGKKNVAMPSVASVDQLLWHNYLISACCSAMPSKWCKTTGE